MKGAIIGDIAGSIYEFDNTFDYGFPLFADHCEFTDDSICTIAIADAILSGKSYEKALRQWCRKYPNPMGAYGSYFLTWLMNDELGPYGSFGNGSAMRVSAVAWLYDNEEDVRREAEASAAVTHNHPEGIKGAVCIALAIFRMRHDDAKSAETFIRTAKEFYGENPFANLPRKGYFDVTCQGCVPLALSIAASATSFEDSIRRAVAYGGDSDTLAAIVGSLAEARFGIPEHIWQRAGKYLSADIKDVTAAFDKRTATTGNKP